MCKLFKGNSQKVSTAYLFMKSVNFLDANLMQMHHFRLKFYAANIVRLCVHIFG